MKKVLTLLFTVLCISTGFGQEKVNGFGKLKLGMLVSDIPELSNVEKMSNYDDYIKYVSHNEENEKIYEEIADTSGENPSHLGSFDTSVRTFTIPSYKVTDNITLKFIKLQFKNNKLFSITCDFNFDLNDGLDIKYGKSKTKLKEKNQYYTNSYGEKITKVDKHYTFEWNTKDTNISLSSTYMIYHNYKGKEDIIKFTILSNETIWNKVYKQERIVQTRIDKRKEDKKKEKLSGL